MLTDTISFTIAFCEPGSGLSCHHVTQPVNIMPSIDFHLAGSFCWADIVTPHFEEAKRFYTSVFGWETRQESTDHQRLAATFLKSGKEVCGLCHMDKTRSQIGIPSHWVSALAVENAEEVSRRVEAADGTILQSPHDMYIGARKVLVQDPTGAVFALWQPKKHIGAALWNEPNTLCWNELYSNNIERSNTFYHQLFGWKYEKSAGAAGQDYYEFFLGDRAVGGMMEIQKEWGNMPPCWSVYFAVENIKLSIEKSQMMGGKVEGKPMEIENVGEFAVIVDPQGAFFSIIQFQNHITP